MSHEHKTQPTRRSFITAIAATLLGGLIGCASGRDARPVRPPAEPPVTPVGGGGKCFYCGGKGLVRCISCDGYGVIGTSMTDPVCNGTGAQTCPVCQGTGRAHQRKF